jgi:hypothetical protein
MNAGCMDTRMALAIVLGVLHGPTPMSESHSKFAGGSFRGGYNVVYYFSGIDPLVCGRLFP